MEKALEKDVEAKTLENYTASLFGKTMEEFGNSRRVAEKLGRVGMDLEMELVEKMNCTNSCNQSAAVQVYSKRSF